MKQSVQPPHARPGPYGICRPASGAAAGTPGDTVAVAARSLEA